MKKKTRTYPVLPRVCVICGTASNLNRRRNRNGDWVLSRLCRTCSGDRVARNIRLARYRSWSAEVLYARLSQHLRITEDILLTLEERGLKPPLSE